MSGILAAHEGVYSLLVKSSNQEERDAFDDLIDQIPDCIAIELRADSGGIAYMPLIKRSDGSIVVQSLAEATRGKGLKSV